MAIIENLGYILIGFITIVSIFLIVLALIEKKLHLKFLSVGYKRNQYYIEKLSKLNINTPVESLRALEKLGKSFFREAFHIKGNPDFSELAYYFNNKNNSKATRFCSDIVKYVYSKTNISKEDLQQLIVLLAQIVSSNKIISKERKEEKTILLMF